MDPVLLQRLADELKVPVERLLGFSRPMPLIDAEPVGSANAEPDVPEGEIDGTE